MDPPRANGDGVVLVTPAQMKAIFFLTKKLGHDESWIRNTVGVEYGVEHLRDLSEDQASEMITTLQESVDQKGGKVMALNLAPAPDSGVPALDEKAITLKSQADAISIQNDGQFVTAGEFLKGVLALKKEITSSWEPTIQAAHKAHRSAIESRDKHLIPVIEAERQIKNKLSAYQLLQETIRRQLEEEEKARVQAETEALEAAARELAEGGEYSAAKATVRQVFDIKPAEVAATPKIKGISFSENWTFSVVDPLAVPREYLMVDEVKIRQVVKALKGDCKIPGVQVRCEKVASGRVA